MNIPTYRMMIDENDDITGVDFISLVKDPAIEEVFLSFSDSKLYFEAQKEKRILYGPLMIPEKRIYRNDTKFGEYYVYFTENDIESIVKKFSKNNYNNNISLEHLGLVIKGTLMENFIIREGMTVKGFEDLPVGTWMGAVYIDDLEFWENFIKSDVVRGFSIEINGLLKKEDFSIDKIWSELLDILSTDITDKSVEKVEELFKKYKFESYNDYPKSASDAAARAISLRDKYDLKCGTLVGWQRANQLAKGENISRETIGRMAAFERHRENSKGDPKEDCGALMWLAWGGDEGIAWAQRKLRQIDAALNSSAYQTIVNKMTKESNEVIIVDIDDTLLKNRSEPIKKTIDYINSKYNEYRIEIITGRNSDERQITEQQLEDVGVKWDGLHMNDLGTVNSDKYKKSIAEELKKKYEIIEAIDNSESARKSYSELGIKVINPVTENFIIKPKQGETKDEYIGRCIGIEINNGYSQNQAAAICISKWENK